MSGRNSRQSFLGPISDEIFAECRACIVGLGGGGSHILQQLAHIGVQNLLLFDPDKIEISNLNRLVGATHADAMAGVFKVEIGTRIARQINPYCRVEAVADSWQQRPKLLRTSDVVFGCIDTFRGRYELEITCRRYMIPYIDIGMEVHSAPTGHLISGQVILSMPGGPCMRCLGFITENDLAHETERYGDAGPRPQVVWPNGILASSAVGVFVQLFSNWSPTPPPVCVNYDGNKHLLFEDKRAIHLAGRACPHLTDVEGTGNPLWIPES
jgi:molybdopterin-synthase adenylyltransferase